VIERLLGHGCTGSGWATLGGGDGVAPAGGPRRRILGTNM
jgi:hypothetical protein